MTRRHILLSHTDKDGQKWTGHKQGHELKRQTSRQRERMNGERKGRREREDVS